MMLLVPAGPHSEKNPVFHPLHKEVQEHRTLNNYQVENYSHSIVAGGLGEMS